MNNELTLDNSPLKAPLHPGANPLAQGLVCYHFHSYLHLCHMGQSSFLHSKMGRGGKGFYRRLTSDGASSVRRGLQTEASSSACAVMS